MGWNISIGRFHSNVREDNAKLPWCLKVKTKRKFTKYLSYHFGVFQGWSRATAMINKLLNCKAFEVSILTNPPHEKLRKHQTVKSHFFISDFSNASLTLLLFLRLLCFFMFWQAIRVSYKENEKMLEIEFSAACFWADSLVNCRNIFLRSFYALSCDSFEGLFKGIW